MNFNEAQAEKLGAAMARAAVRYLRWLGLATFVLGLLMGIFLGALLFGGPQ